MGKNPKSLKSKKVRELLQGARSLAREYKELTGRPLGITGEVGEFEVAQLLKLQLAEARQAGYDAYRKKGRTIKKIEIKSRCLGENPQSGQRVPSIRLNKEWDSVVLVLLDINLEPVEIWEAERPRIKKKLLEPGSKARNERGQLSVSQFKSIGQLVWPRD